MHTFFINTSKKNLEGYDVLCDIHYENRALVSLTCPMSDWYDPEKGYEACVAQMSDLIDGYVDFDKALADPANPAAMLEKFDSGDHLHPSALGYKAMADAINQEAKRGATVIDAMGWYSKENSKVVMCVCRKRDLAMVLKIVRNVDPEAFITIGSVMGVYGKGFEALNKV